MKKDYWKWHSEKEHLNETEGTALFHEREVWWCALGANVGFEQDGNGELFTRPVVILSKFNLDACLVMPLTAKPKKGKYYFPVGNISGREAVAVLSQIRFVDRKRLALKIATMDNKTFQALTKEVVKACFPTLGL
ncbi:MAG: type II toxin-antitoxin system PemK/MazF family toxin [Candidatus Taylorbacteria bacterium]|nr:type II toxin-antitoxin system PemK/MazF family toxin [Candidatus Taylorbacteria bacterium]